MWESLGGGGSLSSFHKDLRLRRTRKSPKLESFGPVAVHEAPSWEVKRGQRDVESETE